MDKNILEKFLQEGRSVSWIAKEMKAGRKTIIKWITRYGLSNNDRKCKNCGKPLSGIQRYYCCSTCKTSHWWKQKSNGASRLTIKARQKKQELVEMFGGSCSICGYNKCMDGLCFHHLNPTEKRMELNNRNIAGRAWDLVMEEANKCQLLCLNCHAEVHSKMNH
jgi:hypothetical protein